MKKSGKKPERTFRKKKTPKSQRALSDRVIERRRKEERNPPKEQPKPAPSVPFRLNKYLAHSGVCSRRQAVEYIKGGKVTVNGEKVTVPAYEVQPDDLVTFNGKPIRPEERRVYLLMNKPKNTITTLSDEKGRKTVMDLIGDKVSERVYPVGRLDRMTTGLLLLTNDGDLAARLAHPSFEVNKYYEVTLDKEVSEDHLKQIAEGLELEDGPAPVDQVRYLGTDKNRVGVDIHIGRNRIVRRLFEHFGYKVSALDRTSYAGLTKKNLPRGWFRELSDREVIRLKHF